MGAVLLSAMYPCLMNVYQTRARPMANLVRQHPTFRQAQIINREGLDMDRSSFAGLAHIRWKLAPLRSLVLQTITVQRMCSSSKGRMSLNKPPTATAQIYKQKDIEWLLPWKFGNWCKASALTVPRKQFINLVELGGFHESENGVRGGNSIFELSQ